MDYRDDFEQTARKTVAALQKRGREPKTWTADDGTSVTGWPFRAMKPYREDILPSADSNYWRESWGHTTVILATDGSFWHYHFNGHADSNDPVDRVSESLSRYPVSWLVGDRGKPFSGAKAELERMPYKD